MAVCVMLLCVLQPRSSTEVGVAELEVGAKTKERRWGCSNMLSQGRVNKNLLLWTKYINTVTRRTCTLLPRLAQRHLSSVDLPCLLS